jgi:hypothetical protein
MFFRQKKIKSLRGTGSVRVILLIGGIITFTFLILFFIFKNSLSGNGQLRDMVYIPENGKGKIFLLYDGSFYYIKKVNRSVTKESIFNKISFSYYDPFEKKKSEPVTIHLEQTPPKLGLFYRDNGLWLFNTSSDDPVYFKILDPVSLREIGNIDYFRKFPEIKAGIANMSYLKTYFPVFTSDKENFIISNPHLFEIMTKDGRKLKFSLEYNRVFKDIEGLIDYSKNLAPPEYNFFVLAHETGNSARKQLFRIKVDKAYHQGRRLFRPVDNEVNLAFLEKSYKNAGVVDLSGDKAFLNGEIIEQDADSVVIYHQKEIGKDAEKMLTCIDQSGKVKWRIPQSSFPNPEQFKESRNHFLFAVDISAKNQGNILIVKFSDIGMLGINKKSGKVEWSFSAG